MVGIPVRSDPQARGAGAGHFRALFLGTTYAGHATRFANLQHHVLKDGRLSADFRPVTGWKEGGLLERIPVPRSIRGRARATAEASVFARVPRPDVIWSSASELLSPFMWIQVGRWRRPLVVDLDATPLQMEGMAPTYFGRPPKNRFGRSLVNWRESVVRSGTTIFTPWSNWAADGLAAEGVPRERIRVVPPGIRLELWSAKTGWTSSGPLRLLFVGGDFHRKGGDLLVELVSGELAGLVEVDIVTRDPVPIAPGVRVHTAEPNSAKLRDLYLNADVFVLPTRAECFGIAAVEALASGLPVIVTRVGGTPDIVDHGRTGWLIDADAASLRAAIGRALENRSALPEMGRLARESAELRFDGAANDRKIIDLMIELASHR